MKGWKVFKTGERLDKKERKKDLIYYILHYCIAEIAKKDRKII